MSTHAYLSEYKRYNSITMNKKNITIVLIVVVVAKAEINEAQFATNNCQLWALKRTVGVATECVCMCGDRQQQQ